jgi:hypothetical protein
VDLEGREKDKVSIVFVCCHRDKKYNTITRLRMSRNRKQFSPDVKNNFRRTSMGENLGKADQQYSLLLLCNA